MDESKFLLQILIGAVLGMVGQGIRLIAGIKKDQDKQQSRSFSESLDLKRLLVSLIMAFVVGSICGCLMAIYKMDGNGSDGYSINKDSILAMISAGYAGTDFIEAFMKKVIPTAKVTG